MENQNNQIAVSEAAGSIANTSYEAVDFNTFLQESENLDDLQEQIILTSEGISLDKVGEHFNGIFWGFSHMTVKDQTTDEIKEIPAVQFLVNKQIRINGGAALVNEFKKINVGRGTKVRVTFTKKEGNLKIYSVSLLG
jgi:hypothetical protein